MSEGQEEFGHDFVYLGIRFAVAPPARAAPPGDKPQGLKSLASNLAKPVFRKVPRKKDLASSPGVLAWLTTSVKMVIAKGLARPLHYLPGWEDDEEIAGAPKKEAPSKATTERITMELRDHMTRTETGRLVWARPRARDTLPFSRMRARLSPLSGHIWRSPPRVSRIRHLALSASLASATRRGEAA